MDDDHEAMGDSIEMPDSPFENIKDFQPDIPIVSVEPSNYVPVSEPPVEYVSNHMAGSQWGAPLVPVVPISSDEM